MIPYRIGSKNSKQKLLSKISRDTDVDSVVSSDSSRVERFSASDFSWIILGKCSICKLEIREKQDILVCNFCNSMFHEEQLIQWLKTDANCPICQREITLIED